MTSLWLGYSDTIVLVILVFNVFMLVSILTIVNIILNSIKNLMENININTEIKKEEPGLLSEDPYWEAWEGDPTERRTNTLGAK